MTPEPPKKQEFTGTFIAAPDTTNPLLGSMIATITGISHDDMPLE